MSFKNPTIVKLCFVCKPGEIFASQTVYLDFQPPGYEPLTYTVVIAMATNIAKLGHRNLEFYKNNYGYCSNVLQTFCWSGDVTATTQLKLQLHTSITKRKAAGGR